MIGIFCCEPAGVVLLAGVVSTHFLPADSLMSAEQMSYLLQNQARTSNPNLATPIVSLATPSIPGGAVANFPSAMPSSFPGGKCSFVLETGSYSNQILVLWRIT